MTHRRGPSGFTLVEMLIAMGMLAAVVSASVGMIIGMNASTRHVRIIGDAQTGARMGLEQLAAEIRAAGAGVSTGQVGIAPGGGSARRLPVIYSGPNVTITEPGGQTIVTNSIFIISSNATFFGADVSSANQRIDTGTMGIVTAASSGVPLTVVCYTVSGGAADCKNDLLPTPLPALLVGDFRNAVYLSPKTLQSPAGVPPTQQLDYFEAASNAYSPDPKAPFGFTPGSAMLRARVTHWYLRQTGTGDPQLMRSFPTLTTTALNAACAASDVPFIDETNAVAGVAGIVMGTVPVDSLQIRFVTDPTGADNPAQFTMVNSISVCDTTVPATLREVRMQIVSRTANWDLQGSSTAKKINYATPGYEGTTPTAGAGGVTQDSYPRRAFNLAVVPRTLQGYRL
jgi:prepilin-type N-terminal cleavage/methylation domain-containing protein